MKNSDSSFNFAIFYKAKAVRFAVNERYEFIFVIILTTKSVRVLRGCRSSNE